MFLVGGGTNGGLTEKGGKTPVFSSLPDTISSFPQTWENEAYLILAVKMEYKFHGPLKFINFLHVSEQE